VLKPDLYEPELNPVYAAALAHYGVVADPARVRDPNRKGSVENAIGHTQATALKGRRFESIEEQNTFLEHWESQVGGLNASTAANAARCEPCSRRKPHLQPLPLLGMQYFTEAQRTVCDDSCVRVDHSSYAARPAPIGSRVLVRVFEHRIEIRDLKTQALLRTHPRAERPGTVVLPDDERVFNPSRETRHILAQAKAIGAGRRPGCASCCSPSKAASANASCGASSAWPSATPAAWSTAPARGPWHDGIYSYRHVKAPPSGWSPRHWRPSTAPMPPAQGELALTQDDR
jgi:hypothetical protein